jgi:solute carrier family 25 citrate transporter 1
MQGLEAHKYKSTIDCVQQLLKNEGPMAFYKGVGPRLTRVCLEVGITMSLYGEIVKVLDKVCCVCAVCGQSIVEREWNVAKLG